MKRRAPLLVAASLAILVSGLVTPRLSRVADEMPQPVDNLARIPERVWARLFPPRVKRTTRLAGLTEPERDAVEALSRQVDGLVVWSSNRSGNHELYLLDLPSRSVRSTDPPLECGLLLALLSGRSPRPLPEESA